MRPLSPDDAEAILRYRSDPVINRHQGWIPSTIQDVIDFIETRISSTIDIADTWYQFVLIRKDTGELIGDVGLHFFDAALKQVELGCSIDKNYQGNGFATEALREAMHYVFVKLDKQRIVASVDPRNSKSIALIERLGLKKEAHYKERFQIRGEWVDDVIYAIQKEDWMNNRREPSNH